MQNVVIAVTGTLLSLKELQSSCKMAVAKLVCNVDVHAKGEPQNEELWFNLVAFNKHAELLLQHANNDQITLSGYIKINPPSEEYQVPALSIYVEDIISAKTCVTQLSKYQSKKSQSNLKPKPNIYETKLKPKDKTRPEIPDSYQLPFDDELPF